MLIFQSRQNLQLLLLSDIQMARTDGLSGLSANSKWGRAYHGNATEHREQSEVEGTHDSIAVQSVCRVVRRLSAKGRNEVPSVEKRELGSED